MLTPLRRPGQHLNPMSRGLGHLERTILAMVERQQRKRQRVTFTALDIEYEAYPGTPQTQTQHVAVLRAMHSFVRKHPQYALIGAKAANHSCSFRYGGQNSGPSGGFSAWSALSAWAAAARCNSPRTPSSIPRKHLPSMAFWQSYLAWMIDQLQASVGR